MQAKAINTESLLLKVSQGKVLEESVMAEVVETLEYAISSDTAAVVPGADEVYSLLLILGCARAKECRSTVEKFLEYHDPYVVALALDILCLKWQEYVDYVERVINFAVGVSWDSDEDIRQTAIKVLGEFLYGLEAGTFENVPRDFKPRIVELLVRILEDEKNDSCTRHSAYYALCRAAGKKWEELPSECALLNFDKATGDVDWEMIEKLQTEIVKKTTSEKGKVSDTASRPKTFRIVSL